MAPVLNQAVTPSHEVSLVKQPPTTQQNSAAHEPSDGVFSGGGAHKRILSASDKPPLSASNNNRSGGGSQSTSGCQSRLESGVDEDEILIVEVQLGDKVKTQLQIARSQNISEVSRAFCKQHGK